MSSGSNPPRFVPTLTEVVHPVVVSVASSGSGTQAPAETAAPLPEKSLHQFEEQLLHRVMQRVDLVLEQRLREAVTQIIMRHTQALGPRLREEIELVVRESVSQAIAQELPFSPAKPQK